jgi:hypothetical protein
MCVRYRVDNALRCYVSRWIFAAKLKWQFQNNQRSLPNKFGTSTNLFNFKLSNHNPDTYS